MARIYIQNVHWPAVGFRYGQRKMIGSPSDQKKEQRWLAKCQVVTLRCLWFRACVSFHFWFTESIMWTLIFGLNSMWMDCKNLKGYNLCGFYVFYWEILSLNCMSMWGAFPCICQIKTSTWSLVTPGPMQ